MRLREIPLTKARTILGRLAKKGGLARGEVVTVTRRGRPALVVQRVDDFAPLQSTRAARSGRLWGSLTITGDLEAASRQVNARLQRTFRARRVG